jgi:polyprenyl-phospho-N-acetylgalactosaminyl synthase
VQKKIIFFIIDMSINQQNKVTVVVPAYNEQAVLRSVAEELLDDGYQVIIIDDGSERSLLPTVQDLPITFLRHSVNLGQGAALQTGIEFALEKGAQWIVSFDADGQHKVSDLEKILAPLREGNADIVLGSRFLQGATHNLNTQRHLLLQIARFVNYLFTGLLLTDAHNGLRAMNRKAAGCIVISENRMAHATEILTQIKKHQLVWKEVPVSIAYTEYSRHKGQSGWNSIRIFFDLLLNKIHK